MRGRLLVVSSLLALACSRSPAPPPRLDENSTYTAQKLVADGGLPLRATMLGKHVELAALDGDGGVAARCERWWLETDGTLLGLHGLLLDQGVAAAFASPAEQVQGTDVRPVGGTVLQVLRDGEELLVGCEPPGGFWALKGAWGALVSTQAATPECAGVRDAATW